MLWEEQVLGEEWSSAAVGGDGTEGRMEMWQEMVQRGRKVQKCWVSGVCCGREEEE